MSSDTDSSTSNESARVRAYLDECLVPILLQGMNQVVKDRPANPVEYLAHYLLQNNPVKSENGTSSNVN